MMAEGSIFLARGPGDFGVRPSPTEIHNRMGGAAPMDDGVLEGASEFCHWSGGWCAERGLGIELEER